MKLGDFRVVGTVEYVTFRCFGCDEVVTHRGPDDIHCPSCGVRHAVLMVPAGITLSMMPFLSGGYRYHTKEDEDDAGD